MKILVAADGSPYTKRMLAYLAVHEQWLDPAHQYTVLHCLSSLPPRAAAYLDNETLRSYYDQELNKVFKPLRAFFTRQEVNAAFVSKIGEPGDTIAAFAKKGRYDLLIMGSHGHGALGSLVMGSVVTKVLAKCETPVLIVR